MSLYFLPAEIKAFSTTLLISTVPAFCAGLAEDIGCAVKPKTRLCAAALSGFIAVAEFGLWLPRVDVPVANDLFAFAPFAILFTIFATTGVSHAFNLIDGVHGLASYTAIATAFGLGFVSMQADLPQIGIAALFLVGGIVGFMLVNYPKGLIFLGDAGAYTIGHALAWCAVVVLAINTEVSAWAMVLIFFWPVADTCFAIVRRSVSGRRTDQPDRLHHHQLALRVIELRVLGRQAREYTNPLTTAVLAPFIALPVVAGVLLWNRPLAAFLILVVFAAMFVGAYSLGFRVARRRHTRTLTCYTRSAGRPKRPRVASPEAI